MADGQRPRRAAQRRVLVEVQRPCSHPHPASRYSNTKAAKEAVAHVPLSMLANKATVDELRKIRNETLAEAPQPATSCHQRARRSCGSWSAMVFCKAKAETQYLAHVREKQQLAERLRRCDELLGEGRYATRASVQDLSACLEEDDGGRDHALLRSSKAYDRYDWNFMFKVLKAMDLHPDFIQMVKIASHKQPHSHQCERAQRQSVRAI